VGYRHELGYSRSAEDGMVGGLEVHDFELDVLGVGAESSPDTN
jgi:hypothetical protein